MSAPSTGAPAHQPGTRSRIRPRTQPRTQAANRPGTRPGGAEPALYYPRFDWLRGALAFTVLLSHAVDLPWVQAGDFAVQVFFVLSGWLIGGILLTLDRRDLPRFYYNRATRIWIPYYLSLALLLAVSVVKEPITGKWVEFVVYKLTMVFNIFGVPQRATQEAAMPLHGTGLYFWSVNAEEQFYLIAPIIIVLLAWKRAGRSPLAWAGIAALMLGTGSEYAGLSLGVLARILLGDGARQTTGRARAVLLVVLAGCVPLLHGVSYPYAAPVAGLAIVLLLSDAGRATAVGAVVGGMSYPLYLNHWLGIFAANAVTKTLHLNVTAVYLAVAILAAVGYAVAHYWFVDRNIHRFRSRLYTARRGRFLTATAYTVMASGLAYGLWMAP